MPVGRVFRFYPSTKVSEYGVGFGALTIVRKEIKPCRRRTIALATERLLDTLCQDKSIRKNNRGTEQCDSEQIAEERPAENTVQHGMSGFARPRPVALNVSTHAVKKSETL
jgi:hypothetical protein